LGDLLLQVVLQCQLRRELGDFTFEQVMERLADKLVHRHPHVFGQALALHTPEEVLKNWEKLKAEEKRQKGESILESIPRHLPALQKAHHVQAKVARVGFDWPDAQGVISKIDEELAEFKAAAETNDKAGQAEEVGDLLFTLVNLCRFLGISPEEALQATTSKFTRRFQRMEANMLKIQRPIEQLTPAEFDAAWESVKDEERRS
jgi:tetrapyrrole methylase family protein/MazG family protein